MLNFMLQHLYKLSLRIPRNGQHVRKGLNGDIIIDYIHTDSHSNRSAHPYLLEIQEFELTSHQTVVNDPIVIIIKLLFSNCSCVIIGVDSRSTRRHTFEDDNNL